MNKVLIIGCGHMGSALLSEWSKKKYYQFTIIDPKSYKIIPKKIKKNNIKCFESISQIKNINIFDIVVLAVTPQIVAKVLENYKFLKFKNSCVLVSIIAGKKISYLKKMLPNIKQIVRVMPNMPALIGEGVSCLTSNIFLSKNNKKKISELFLSVGIIVWLNKEKEIDVATAISGSGPGYVFYLIDAMEKAANKIGLNKTLNKKIIFQTFFGSLKLMKQTEKDASDLANQIAIKGGTTEAGINIMKKNNIHKIFSNIILASYKKANLLGNKK